ncbi:MAG: DUF2100 domain-containing protein [Methanobacteriaceae archaeon]|nr:DUF2100 domain-containing protein [Methanobacteriaceae archaeon]MDO9627907.1 DUF2100 domain-containing protein [Methanobacteriaceae archaeon]
MEKNRLNQAEDLIKKAGSSGNSSEIIKEPREGIINVQVFEKALKDLIEAEDFIYSSLPSHKLNLEDSKLFAGKMLDARAKINEILADFGVLEKVKTENKISDLSKGLLIVTTKNNFKKALVKLGIDVQQIIVAGVPLEVSDMKEINPKIPEAALQGISKKIEHTKNDINRKIENMGLKKVLVIAEPDINGEILGKRSKELYNAHINLESNLKDINADKLIGILLEYPNQD